MRETRKQEHIENFLKSSYKTDNLFDDIYINHQALSNIKYEDVDTSSYFLGKKISFPFMINAITGGTTHTKEINEDLSIIANKFNIPIAVGSQAIAINNIESKESFKIVRENNPDGIVIGNLGATEPIEKVLESIEMIDADAFQLHLNLGQELVMNEGERDFSKLSANIKEIVEKSPVPIIVKEVGMGLSVEVINELYDLGVRNVDISGLGGSNFIEIENLRNNTIDYSELYNWGIPTAYGLIEAINLNKKDLTIIASGGITNSEEILKAMVLGADITAGAGEILNFLLRGNLQTAENYIFGLREKYKILMVLSGVKSTDQLKNVDYKIIGRLKELLDS